MERSRMEAFSDGVLAIIITIMVLNLRVPAGSAFADFMRILPQLVIYALSFTYIGICWNNHHYTLYALTNVNGKILRASLWCQSLWCQALLNSFYGVRHH